MKLKKGSSRSFGNFVKVDNLVQKNLNGAVDRTEFFLLWEYLC